MGLRLCLVCGEEELKPAEPSQGTAQKEEAKKEKGTKIRKRRPFLSFHFPQKAEFSFAGGVVWL